MPIRSREKHSVLKFSSASGRYISTRDYVYATDYESAWRQATVLAERNPDRYGAYDEDGDYIGPAQVEVEFVGYVTI